MSKLDDILREQPVYILKGASEGAVGGINLTKQQIKDLMSEVFEQARDEGGRNEYELAAAFSEIVEKL